MLYASAEASGFLFANAPLFESFSNAIRLFLAVHAYPSVGGVDVGGVDVGGGFDVGGCSFIAMLYSLHENYKIALNVAPARMLGNSDGLTEQSTVIAGCAGQYTQICSGYAPV